MATQQTEAVDHSKSTLSSKNILGKRVNSEMATNQRIY
jgi:hypothetical protein